MYTTTFPIDGYNVHGNGYCSQATSTVLQVLRVLSCQEVQTGSGSCERKWIYKLTLAKEGKYSQLEQIDS